MMIKKKENTYICKRTYIFKKKQFLREKPQK